MIYVKNLISLISEEGVEKNKIYQPDKNTVKIHPIKGKISENLSTFEENVTVDNLECGKNLPLLNSNYCPSRGVNITPLEGEKIPPIKTDITNTKITETDLFRPTFPPNPTTTYPQEEEVEQEEDGWRDLKKADKDLLVRSELYNAFGEGEDGLYCLFSSYRKNKSKMKTLVDMLLDMIGREETASRFDDYSDVKFNLKIMKLYSNTLVDMLTGKNMIKVKQGFISYSELFDKLISHITYDEGYNEVRLDDIAQCTVLAYGEANKETAIKYPAAYMKSCILTVLNEGAIRSEAFLQYRYG